MMEVAILRELADAPADRGVSVPRLGKRLGQGASVVLRQLSLMGDATIGGTAGPGWVRVAMEDGRWVAYITPAGRTWLASVPAAAGNLA